jgi:enediyne biosynthesis protein E7
MNVFSGDEDAGRRSAPGPRGLPGLGSLPELWSGGMFPLFQRMWGAHGDVSRARLGRRSLYLIVHPDHVHHVLVGRRDIYTKQAHRARPLIGDGLSASTGELWKQQRELLQPLFQVRALAPLTGHIQGAVQRVAERWEGYADRGEPVEIVSEMVYLTLDVITRAMTGDPLVDEGERLRRAIRTAIDFVVASKQVFRLPLGLPTPANRRFHEALAVIDAFVARAIATSRRRPEDSSMLAFLLRAEGADGRALPERLIRDETVNLLLAGHDTTASALAWTWHLLAEHRDARERLHEELEAVLSGRSPTGEERGQLPWLTAVLQESMRLYPPIWLIPRHVAADDEIAGYHVPAGATLMICSYLTHRHPAFWSEPERFRPERFTDGAGQPRPYRASYNPFGYGPRTCIGNHLAMIEMQLAMASLAQRFELSRPAGSRPVEREFGTALRPRDGLWMRIERRH